MSMSTKSLHAAVLAVALVAATAAGAQVTPGQKHQDWTSGCETSPNNDRQTCFIFQKLIFRETGKELAAIAIGYPPQGGQPLAVITLPLGMLLPPGVVLKGANLPPQAFPVQFCQKDSCRSHIPLSPEMVNALRAGTVVELSFQDLGRREITLPISLLGFTKALASLAPR